MNKDEKSSFAKTPRDLMEKIVSLCKRRGFIYPASEIYGGIGGIYDYGPLGVEFKNNVRSEWWNKFVRSKENILGLDSGIIMNPKVWEASGHTSSFADPLVECKKCHLRFRQDEIDNSKDVNIKKCKEGGEHQFTEPRNFNILVKTYLGPVEDSSTLAYLRGETAQGIFINFQNILQSNRVKVPFGVAQVGKSFRNEITPKNFIFRTREFEQAEIEYFIEPDKEKSKSEYAKWIEEAKNFFLDLGVKKDNLSVREHEKDELSHYSIGTSDIEYKFPFGVSELVGIAQRTDYDLKQHQKFSGEDLQYFDEANNKKYFPYVVEPAFGIDRAALAFLVDAYDESDGNDGRAEGEVTLRLDPKLAPIKVAVFPLVKKENLPGIAKDVYKMLKEAGINTFYDESGSVGRRYRRQDEIGTPWCVTVDFDSLKNNDVTVRDRDSMKQERVKIDDLIDYIDKKLN